ncbi:MAG TPA: hypothetical protein ENG83_15300 [Nitrospirae bacterium]|nr:hypothetical protein BMS3Abin06_00903 [bacterium BMS3Abin06]HDH13535.1 hypothetical protein [Nitrospirota bacterium]HDZ01025.1 hypothetical protein [Nitrospirota bacterium]
MKKIALLIVALIVFLIGGDVDADSFEVGVHSGYGVIKYEEDTDAFGTEIESETSLDTILLGVSGEYSFAGLKNFFAAFTTDWALGLKDVEKWREDNIEKQTNDISIFGQFYDISLGYRNSLNNFYYRLYVSGGWDGLHFRRKNFVVNGVALSTATITEDFSLWKTAGGLGLGYKPGKWAIDGRAAFAYYFDGDVRNSNNEGMWFDTNGTCLDIGVGVAREITRNINLSLGGSYKLVKLDESEIKPDMTQSGKIIDTVFPWSKTLVMVGVVNLTYAF